MLAFNPLNSIGCGLAKRLQLAVPTTDATGRETAMNTMKRLWKDEEAANAVEYGLITAVIAVALIGALFFFSNAIQGMFSDSANRVATHP